MLGSRAVLVGSLFVSGCFVELGGGYYPFVHQTITDAAGTATQSSQGAWAASIKIGFFLDLPVEPYGLALGWAPKGADLVLGKDPQRAAGGDGHMFRGDLVLPPSLLRTDVIRTRVIGEFDYYTSASFRRPGSSSYTDHDTGGGHRFFVGMGVSHTAAYGSYILSLGLDRNSLHTPSFMTQDNGAGSIFDPAIETSAWGAKGSITIGLFPEVGRKKNADPEPPPNNTGLLPTPPAPTSTSSESTKCAGGAWKEICDDFGGNCRTEWVCP